MEAKEFVKNYARMCKRHEDCDNCPLFEKGCYITKYVTLFPDKLDERIVDAVEKWAKENPVETNKDRVFKLFPNAVITLNGVLDLCPKVLDANCECIRLYTGVRGEYKFDCSGCKSQFWNSEYKGK